MHDRNLSQIYQKIFEMNYSNKQKSQVNFQKNEISDIINYRYFLHIEITRLFSIIHIYIDEEFSKLQAANIPSRTEIVESIQTCLSSHGDTDEKTSLVPHFLTKFLQNDGEIYYFDSQRFAIQEIELIRKSQMRIPLIFNSQDWKQDFGKLRLDPISLKLILKYFLQISEHDKTGISYSLKEFCEDLGFIYESFQLENQKKLHQGIFYSPQAEIKHIILFSTWNVLKSHFKLTIEEKKVLISNLEKIYSTPISQLSNKSEMVFFQRSLTKPILTYLLSLKILDPACGTGLFLTSWFQFIQKLQVVNVLSHNQEEIQPQNIKSQIYGFDINKFAIILTDFSLWILENRLTQFKLPINSSISSYERTNTPLIKWELFAEDYILFQRESLPKFNLILGNPPYIRNRDLKHPFHSDDIHAKEYRQLIRKTLDIDALRQYKFSHRIDYSLYFYILGIQQLTEMGVLCFICSNSWMNVQYGYEFQKYLLDTTRICGVFENLHQSFSNAQINTVITAFERISVNMRDSKEVKLRSAPALFIRLSEPYQKLNISTIFPVLENIYENFEELFNSLPTAEHGDKISKKLVYKESQEYRIVALSHYSLISFNNFSTNLEIQEYNGFNWNNYFFYAPIWFLKLWLKLGKNCIRLGQIGVIKRGITTNCNDYFILEKTEANQYRNGFGDEFNLPNWVLQPILISPKDLRCPLINPDQMINYLFTCPYDKSKLKKNRLKEDFKQALEYIEYGESVRFKIRRGSRKGQLISGVQKLSSFQLKYKKNPGFWYHFPSINPNISSQLRIFIQKIFDTQYKMGICSHPIQIINTMYELHLKTIYIGEEEFIFGLLQSVLMMISLELQGRLNFGGGALDTATFDIENIIIPHPDLISKTDKVKIIQLSKKLAQRNFQSSEKLFSDPLQQELDSILCKILGLNVPITKIYHDLLQIQSLRVRK